MWIVLMKQGDYRKKRGWGVKSISYGYKRWNMHRNRNIQENNKVSSKIDEYLYTGYINMG
jgi:hypothetical protein